MNKIEYYAKEINILCFGVCLMIVAVYWVQQLSPELYALIQVLLESITPQYYIKGIDPAQPIDFVHKII